MNSAVLDPFSQTSFEFCEKKVSVSRSWSIATKRGGILQSKCTCKPKSDESNEQSPTPIDTSVQCNICKFIGALPNMNGLPDMLFHDSFIRLEHQPTGVAIEFNAIDSLKAVKTTQDPLKVAVADGWQSARSDFPFANRILKPYDWTYTTDYKGTLLKSSTVTSHADTNKEGVTPESDSSKIQGEESSIPRLEIGLEETSERIDVNKLKEREEIIFYDDITLYEDELADHGVSKYSVKVRVMPGSLYLLARLYLRIDEVLVRINDTRIYHEFRKNYLLREYTNREARIKSLNLPLRVLLDPNELMNHLPVIQTKFDKLILP